MHFRGLDWGFAMTNLKVLWVASAMAAGMAPVASASAATFNLGVFVAPKTQLSATGALSPGNPSNTYTFTSHLIGQLGINNFVKVSFAGPANVVLRIYQGVPGSGTLLRSVGTSGSWYTLLNTFGAGRYYGTVTSNSPSTASGTYRLTLTGEGRAAPVPGPAALVVFGAGAAAMAARKRKAAANVAS